MNAAAQASKIKNPEQLNYRLLLQLLRDYDAKEAVSENAVLDLLNYVADMLVGHPRTGRQTDAHLEQFLAHTVDVSRITSVHRLFVHRLPQRTRFDTCGIQSYAHCLHVIIRLAVGNCSRSGVGNTCGTSYGTGYHLLVSIFLTFYFQVRVESGCTEPEVGVIFRSRVTVHCHTLYILQQFHVQLLHMAVMGNMLVEDGHLASAYAGADVAHAVVVAYGLVLVVGV